MIVPLIVAVGAMVDAYVGMHGGACYDVAWTAAAVSTVIGTFAARQRAQVENRLRWTLWTLAAVCWLVGQLFWDLYGIIGAASDPNLADVSWWACALLVITSMLYRPRGERALIAMAALEALPLICAAISLCLALLWGPFAHSDDSLASRLSDLTYACVYATATILVLQAILGRTLHGLRRVSFQLLLGGAAAVSFAFMLWSDQLLRGTYMPGRSGLDPIWVCGLGAIAIGSLLMAWQPTEPVASSSASQLSVVLPAGMFCLLFAVLLAGIISSAPRGPTEILVLGILCSGAALIVRSTLLSRRLGALLSRERAALGQVVDREAELARLNEQLVEDSRHDPLTGLGNRRALSDDLPMYKALQREQGESIALLLCDVDHFKAYNDCCGHLAGDQALRVIAARARGALRVQDAVYRYGGEELLLILRGVDGEEALEVAERVRESVAHAAIAHPRAELGMLTVSVGLACGLQAPEEMLAHADAALYQAKESGRNRVTVADGVLMEPAPGRLRTDDPAAPAPRHLRSMLAVSQAAASGLGTMPVLGALADAIRNELFFNVVVVNLCEPDDRVRAVIVLGDAAARELLLDTTSPLPDWEKFARSALTINGALWLPAGTYDRTGTESEFWRAPMVPSLEADSWDPDDMLLLPLRNAGQEVLGYVAVDQPVLGLRPTEAEISVLMAVVDHAGLALDQVQQHGGASGTESDAVRLAAVMLLAEALDLRDASTALHSRTVGRLAGRTAIELGFTELQVERVQAAGVLHDLGKLSISDAILQKQTALDELEWREMRRHPEVGARILEHAGMHDIAGWVRAHHERVDGLGYPRGLQGEAISLEARILSVADAYEAMIADRPYRPGMPAEAAAMELQRCAGTQFDPKVISAFLRALETQGAGAELPSIVHAH